MPKRARPFSGTVMDLCKGEGFSKTEHSLKTPDAPFVLAGV